jgi:PAS domain S-box-containing protein
MKESSILGSDTDRIEALHQLQIIETVADKDFEDIAALASNICETPGAAIAFEDANRFWFRAALGIDLTEIPKKEASFLFNTEQDDLLIIHDCLEDERFRDNPFLKGKSGFRFFASAALVNENGITLGYLFVMDKKPRKLTDTQVSGLQMLARQAAAILTLRLNLRVVKETAEDTRGNEELMHTIFNKSIDAIIVMDTDGIITQWNPKAREIFGWEPKEVIGKYFHDIVIPVKEQKKYLERLKLYEAKKGATALNNTIEITAIRKNNAQLDIALGISPIIIKGQRFYINFASDITDRVIAAKNLDKQKEFYENILNKLPADIAVFDPEHTYLFVNPGGIKDEQLRNFIVGKDDFEYVRYRNRDISIAQTRRDQFLEVKKSGREIRWEDSIKDPEGNPITHLRRLFPVHNEKGELTMVIGFGIDITDRKIMEEKQTALVKQLSAQNTQLIDFCNIVSHNLRAPLVNMSMLVNFIQESGDEEEKKLLIDKLNPVLENLHVTFNELVESIQIKQDLEIKSEKIRLSDYLQRTIEGLKMEINKSHALIEYNFDDAPVIHWPPKYLLSLLHNLVSNALKYQSPDRRPIIKLETRKIDDTIILSVKDNGLGIDMIKHKDNFFKIGRVFHRHPNAKGFGLFMTKTQVDAMEGRIWVDSKPDEGATFFIEFKKQ